MKVLQIYEGIYSKADGITSVIVAQRRYLKDQLGGGLIDLSFGEQYDEKRRRPVHFAMDLIRNRKADVAIFHGYYKLWLLPVYVFCRAFRIKFVLVPHGAFSTASLHKSRVRKVMFHYLVGNFVVKGAHFVRFLNENEADNAFTVPARVRFLPNGVAIPERLQAEQTVVSDEVLRLLFLGRIDIRHKGLDRIVGLAKMMACRKTTREFVVEIYGSDNIGDLRKVEDLIRKEGLESLIRICGPVFGADKDAVLRRADVFILLSRYEGMPIAFLEAISYGLPVVVTRETNVADLVLEAGCGVVVESIDESAAAAVCNLVNSEERLSQASSAALHLAKKSFDWRSVVTTMLDQLEEVHTG